MSNVIFLGILENVCTLGTWKCKSAYAWLVAFLGHIMLDFLKDVVDGLVIIMLELKFIMVVEYVKYHDGKILVGKWQTNLSLNSNLMDVHIRRHPSLGWWSVKRFLWHVAEKLNIVW